ncbi:MAG: hypothetical protein SWH68_03590, partial [Thermodesulfobacteriota bacterium]|nr:hypothetical protein [Thermodesulfobacteriota bacterium]
SYRPNWLYLEMKVMSEEKKSYMNLMEMLEGVSAKRFSSTINQLPNCSNILRLFGRYYDDGLRFSLNIIINGADMQFIRLNLETGRPIPGLPIALASAKIKGKKIYLKNHKMM